MLVVLFPGSGHLYVDHLLVLRLPDGELERNVELLEEVRFPGTYPIQKGKRLSFLLRRAGGFTEEPYLREAGFTRESARAAQVQRLQELIQSISFSQMN
ncbi:hypothetical protein NKDENANG_01262 [Candidatus Entotheonellaceae bacterium PAL068K]